ncbi:uncharacterized protein J4E79_006028 [Alternaria viburni]|uniref:uncharacterized protein n=1 Tax=Alternaria viburni TaxID=566460 RepID=UPI0020C3A3A4|nr:uncharacterized protein J4E79_006028 [Alternaria viburni]KAI4659496.1 hypothetical protein J4E79_006028 [Alternaria viburni]
MSSRSGDSDIHPDRIQAREDQYRRDSQARYQSPVRNRSFDVTDLGAIGALFDVPEDESWPPSLELTDHDALSDSANLTKMTTDTSMDVRRNSYPQTL